MAINAPALSAHLGTGGKPLQSCGSPSEPKTPKTGSAHWLFAPQARSFEQCKPLAAHDCPKVPAVMQVLVFESQKLVLAQAQFTVQEPPLATMGAQTG
jgi:hypothetical protein